MFQQLEVAPADPILGLTDAFQRDPNPNKINLGVGVYKDDRGTTSVLKCVKEAEQRLWKDETTKNYLGIEGSDKYDRHVPQLLLGATHEVVQSQRVVTVQTPGGTGALRVAADFLKAHAPRTTVWLSRPTWANHPAIFQSAGLPTAQYGYFDEQANQLDFPSMLHDLERASAGDVVLLHGCCHNPTGIDPDASQWSELGELIRRKQLLALVDFAYQGFGDGLDEDAAGLRTLVGQLDELMVASSYSKNFGLYRERVGALSVVTGTAAAAEAVMSQLKRSVRTNYSNPPAHGGLVVATILDDPQLRQLWISELAEMRQRIHDMRTLFVDTMMKYAPQADFGFLQRQRGMFSFSGLSLQQVEMLRKEYAIYIVGAGRINVAGITQSNVDRLCQAIAAVL